MAALLLGIDTCGPSGSAALGRLDAGRVEILGQTELAGRSYSATLVSAVAELLERAGTSLEQIHALVTVSGPGSFTGVRVGLSAGKGLAEAAGLPVVAVSRLEVLAARAQTEAAALDAHRGEVFLRVAGHEPTELLAGPEELAGIQPIPGRIAVCDEAAAVLLAKAWPDAVLVRSVAPTAADALILCVPRVERGAFADLLLLDGHYLRRSDAEIFGKGTENLPVPRKFGLYPGRDFSVL